MKEIKNKKIRAIVIIAVFVLMALLILDLFVNISTVEIILYKKDDSMVFNYNGNEYLLICEENADKFSSDLYDSYQNYLPRDFETVANTSFRRCVTIGNVYSYIFPYKVRVIYDENKVPIMIEANNVIICNDYYLIAN